MSRRVFASIWTVPPIKELEMGKKNRKGNREQKKPKQPKLPPQTASSIAEFSKQQILNRRRATR